jgi:hypothetical protein
MRLSTSVALLDALDLLADRDLGLFDFDPATMIIQPIDFLSSIENPLNAREPLDTSLAFIKVFEIVFLQ